MTARARLEIVKGAARQTLSMEAGRPSTIGRSSNADLQIVSGPVSRVHCQLQFDGKQWLLTDLDSRNGTWIGTERVKSRPITHGTIFLLGKRVAIRFQVVEAPKAARPAKAPAAAPAPTELPAADEGTRCSFCDGPYLDGEIGVPAGEDKAIHQQCVSVSKLIGVEIGGVRVIERVGGFGHVHRLRAHQPSLSRHVTLYAFDKEGSSAPDFGKRLLDEVRGVSRLLHPRIIQIHDLIEEQGQSLILTEYFPGQTLEEILATRKFVKVPEAMAIVSQVVDGLAYAEGQDLLVDRLFPREILVSEEHSARLDYFRPPVPVRTPVTDLCYLAPEIVTAGRMHPKGNRPDQQDREAAGRSAIYSLGAVFYHMMAGIPPHDGQTEEELMPKILKGMSPSLSRVNLKVSPALARVVERAMSKEPQDRPASFSALQVDLKKLVSPTL